MSSWFVSVYDMHIGLVNLLLNACKGMLTPKRLNILRKAFDRAKCSGLHYHVQPPPISFASKLVGLIARKDTSDSKLTNKKNRLFRTDNPLPHHRRLLKVGPAGH